MITIRKSSERGHADHGWLKSHHSFSFAEYHDPRHMGFGNLRVINEDRIAPGTGFGLHGHRDMEILSYVLDGALSHQDDMGNSASIVPGDVQRMTAGTGVRHSEQNGAASSTTHFLQIWLLPNQRGIPPGYDQKHFSADDKRGRLRLVASPTGQDGSLTLHSDASIYAGLIDGVEAVDQPLPAERKTYVQVVRGDVNVNGKALQAGDAAMLEGESRLELTDGHASEVLVFDLAA